MIQQPAFPVEPWALRETELDLDLLAQTESVFALSNGHIGLRGNLDEGEPHGLPGTYLNGVYEIRPLPYAEAGYGYPESGQTVINVTNGKLIRLLVDDEPFDVRYGKLRAHERVLDFRAGTLSRTAEWVSPAGRAVRVTSTRLVSFTQRAVAAICYEVEPVDEPGPDRRAVRAGGQRAAADGQPAIRARPPRSTTPLVGEYHDAPRQRPSLLVHRTKRSGLRVGRGDGPPDRRPGRDAESSREAFEDGGLVTAATPLEPGRAAAVVKFVAYGWSGERSLPALRDQVAAALSAAPADRLGRPAGRAARTTSTTSGTAPTSRSTATPSSSRRCASRLFHVLQAGARGEQRADPGQGPDRPGLRRARLLGHRDLRAAGADATPPPSRRRRAALAAQHAADWPASGPPSSGCAGAAFPWRTIAGEECSGYWPAGTAAFHVNADIADAVVRYVDATGDEDFEPRAGASSCWSRPPGCGARSATTTPQGRFRIDGVTGPDEYSAIADNNVYTNLMAQRNLLRRGGRGRALPGPRPGSSASTPEESASWRDAAERDVHPVRRDARRAPAGRGLHPAPGLGLRRTPRRTSTRCCCTSRTSTCTASRSSSRPTWCWPCTCAARRSPPSRRRGTSTTTRRSRCATRRCPPAPRPSWPPRSATSSWRYDYLGEAALMDLDDLEHNTRDGVHIASLAGTWIALVAGFGGLRHRDGAVCFAPRLPDGLARLAFTVHAPGTPAAGRDQPRGRDVLPGLRRAARPRAPRRQAPPVGRQAPVPSYPGHTVPAPAQPAAGARTDSPPAHRGPERVKPGRSGPPGRVHRCFSSRRVRAGVPGLLPRPTRLCTHRGRRRRPAVRPNPPR